MGPLVSEESEDRRSGIAGVCPYILRRMPLPHRQMVAVPHGVQVDGTSAPLDTPCGSSLVFPQPAAMPHTPG